MSKKIHSKAGAVTELKEIWLRMSDDARDYWLERFSSSVSQAELRKEIQTRLKVSLNYDSKLTRFRAWVEEQQELGAIAEKLEERKRDLLDQGLTLEQAQEVLLANSAAYAVAKRDFKLGLKTSAEITRAKAATLDRDRFEFDAAQACLAKLPELKSISTDKTLTEPQKVEAIRLKLFGAIAQQAK